MTDFATELLAAQMAQRDAWEAQTRLTAALESRGRHVARAWACRPGGTAWNDLVQAFNAGLPAGAHLKVSALRLDELNYREPSVVDALVARGREAFRRLADSEDAGETPCPHLPGWRRLGTHDQMPYCGQCGADLTGETDGLAG